LTSSDGSKVNNLTNILLVLPASHTLAYLLLKIHQQITNIHDSSLLILQTDQNITYTQTFSNILFLLPKMASSTTLFSFKLSLFNSLHHQSLKKSKASFSSHINPRLISSSINNHLSPTRVTYPLLTSHSSHNRRFQVSPQKLVNSSKFLRF